ncbi:MAG TPA: ABC transporter ATP-binding protein [Bryobacteraceae bacterium]|nr:ABC transporter ATP-binding protein [Bryobacteraceae bacterium]
MPDGTLLSLRQITKRYGSLTAVDGLSLEVQRGEIFGLLGPNGAGKTTLIHCAIGLLEPDGGEVVLSGGNPREPRVRAHMGIAPQVLSLYELLSAEENLSFFGKLYGLDGRRLAERVASSLAFVGLESRRRDAVKNYSGGMQRRLNLAAALLHDPEILLLDEPTVGVDPQSRNSIFDNILALKREGRTIVYTTHYMEEAERLCDRVGIVDHGRLLSLDTVQGLLASQGGLPRLVVETGGREIELFSADPLGELNRLAATAPIDRFRLEQPTLEQVFLNLTGRTLRD